MLGLCHLRLCDKERALHYFKNVKNWKMPDHDDATYEEAINNINKLEL